MTIMCLVTNSVTAVMAAEGVNPQSTEEIEYETVDEMKSKSESGKDETEDSGEIERDVTVFPDPMPLPTPTPTPEETPQVTPSPTPPPEEEFPPETGAITVEEIQEDQPQMAEEGEVVKEDVTTVTNGESSTTIRQLSPDTVYKENFRFSTIKKKIFVSVGKADIYELTKDSAKVVGRLPENGIGYVLEDKDGWSYIESGNARGFISNDNILKGKDAKAYQKSVQDKIDSIIEERNKANTRVDEVIIYEELTEEELTTLKKQLAKDSAEENLVKVEGDKDKETNEEEMQGLDGGTDIDSLIEDIIKKKVPGADSEKSILSAKDREDVTGDKNDMGLASEEKVKLPEGIEKKDGKYYKKMEKEVITSEAVDISELKLPEFKYAVATVPYYENDSYSYKKVTTNETVVDAEYALAAQEEVNIYEEKSDKSRVVGTMKKGNICYFLADRDNPYAYVESDDVRGFVDKNQLIYGQDVINIIDAIGVEIFDFASQNIRPEENRACYYTITSTTTQSCANVDGKRMAVSSSSTLRRKIVDYALQFVGKPYVWGGEDPNVGADCSGFVQYVYKHFGYNIPRVSQDQSNYGEMISVSEAKPGDLLFPGSSGTATHVVMYIGNGQVVEARGRQYGIVVSELTATNVKFGRRIIQDTQQLSSTTVLSNAFSYFAKYESNANYDQGFSSGDGYHAMGYYQFDNRYCLQDFLKYCYDSDSTKYSMFEAFLTVSKDSLANNQGLEAAWHEAYAADPTDFSSKQDEWEYKEYYEPVEKYLKENGIDLSRRHDAIKGLCCGISNLFGQVTGARKILAANISNDITDAQFAKAVCNYLIETCPGNYTYGSSYANRYSQELSDVLALIEAE